jgi:hypothetical protein
MLTLSKNIAVVSLHDYDPTLKRTELAVMHREEQKSVCVYL